MRVDLTFDVDDYDIYEVESALYGGTYRRVLSDVLNNIRNILKYEEAVSDDTRRQLEKLREVVLEGIAGIPGVD